MFSSVIFGLSNAIIYIANKSSSNTDTCSDFIPSYIAFLCKYGSLRMALLDPVNHYFVHNVFLVSLVNTQLVNVPSQCESFEQKSIS